MSDLIILCDEGPHAWTDRERLFALGGCPSCGGELHALDLPAGAAQVARALTVTARWVQNAATRENIGAVIGRRTRAFDAADVIRLQEMRRKPGWMKGRARKIS